LILVKRLFSFCERAGSEFVGDGCRLVLTSLSDNMRLGPPPPLHPKQISPDWVLVTPAGLIDARRLKDLPQGLSIG